MGSLFRPKVPAAPPPPPDPIPQTLIDNINGTKSTPVKNADGSYTTTFDRLPLSPEEKAYEDNLIKVRDDSLGWIQKITADPNYQSDYIKGFLKDYEQSGLQGIEKAYKARTSFEETNLARYGVDDSTAATELRAQRGNDLSGDIQQIERDKSAIALQARDDELNKANAAFGLATGRQDVQLSQLTNSIAQGNSLNLGLTGLKQQRDLAVYGAQNQYNTLKANASAQGMQTFGQLVGMAAGAATGGMGGFGASGGGLGGGFTSAPMSAARSRANGITWL